MTDRIIHLAVSGDDIFGLSEMGSIYQLIFNREKQIYDWELVVRSPNI